MRQDYTFYSTDLHIWEREQTSFLVTVEEKHTDIPMDNAVYNLLTEQTAN